jgi:type II secretory ATPase GspE/PulE/Tfp pilus assembly ATPase PilB-like protein
MEKISARFKVMANLVTYQAGMPQDGAAVGGPELDGVQLRISIFPTTRGEKVVARLFDPRDRRFDLNALGFDDVALKGLLRLLKRSNGLLLFTGPTGSGKTSTMYSALCYIIERDGIEHEHQHGGRPGGIQPADGQPDASQSRAGISHTPWRCEASCGKTRKSSWWAKFATQETAAIAVQAGLTGHLVISTIHAGTSAGAFTRLINMEIEPFMLASSVLGVMGLRLVRRNCPELRTALRTRPKPVEDYAGSACCPKPNSAVARVVSSATTPVFPVACP